VAARLAKSAFKVGEAPTRYPGIRGVAVGEIGWCFDEIEDVSCVTYEVSSKPPATITEIYALNRELHMIVYANKGFQFLMYRIRFIYTKYLLMHRIGFISVWKI